MNLNASIYILYNVYIYNVFYVSIKLWYTNKLLKQFNKIFSYIIIAEWIYIMGCMMWPAECACVYI